MSGLKITIGMLDLEKITTEVRKIAVEAGSFLREERRKFRR